MEPESRPALALEGAVGVDTALLAASIQHLTLIHVCRRKGHGEEGITGEPSAGRPRFSCVAHPKCSQGARAGLLFTSLLQQSKEKGNFMVFFQVPAGTASVVSASEVLVN